MTISEVTEPILSQRVVDQVIRLREGEASILGGIQDKQDTVSWSGIPGLSSIPLLKYLFGSKDHTISEDELVFLVVPHIVRSQSLNQVNLRTVDVGVGTSIDLRHVPVDRQRLRTGAAPVATPTCRLRRCAAPRPPAERPNVGTFPGQSAAAAAPAALRQMSQSTDAAGAASSAAIANPSMNVVSPPGGATPALHFAFNPPSGPVAPGSTFQVPVVLRGGVDVASVPLQIHYDAEKLELVNVGPGDFLGKDAALVHSDNGTGGLTISASRAPGAPGVNGAGVVCVLSFQAKAAGESSLSITKSAVTNSTQKPIPAQNTQLNIVVK